jgi:hypothetical protein
MKRFEWPHVNYAGGGQATFTLVYETVDNTWKVEDAVLEFAR